MLAPKPLIFYCPGSRGDFLAAVLTDQIDRYYEQYTLHNNGLDYYKMHGINEGNNPFHPMLDESTILKHRDYSIRIKLATSDYITVARLGSTKGLPAKIDGSDAEMWENKYRKLDIKFKHIVWFSDLFKVEFLKHFYQRFNGRPMPAEFVPMIEHNIALQLNYKP